MVPQNALNVLVLKYGLNLGAPEDSAPWTPDRGLASGPHPFGASQQPLKRQISQKICTS